MRFGHRHGLFPAIARTNDCDWDKIVICEQHYNKPLEPNHFSLYSFTVISAVVALKLALSLHRNASGVGTL